MAKVLVEHVTTLHSELGVDGFVLASKDVLHKIRNQYPEYENHDWTLKLTSYDLNDDTAELRITVVDRNATNAGSIILWLFLTGMCIWLLYSAFA